MAHVLSSQDLLGRINFLDQRVLPAVATFMARKRFPNDQVLELVPYLIPFWTVANLAMITVFSRDIKGAFSVSSIVNIGMSISAAPPDHWASGLILRDDLESLFQAVVFQPDLIYPDWPTGDYDFGTISERTVLQQWDPERAPRFHYSYPVLTGSELVHLYRFPAAILQLKYLSTQAVSVSGRVRNLRVAILAAADSDDSPLIKSVYAIPSYRMIYLVKLASGKEAIYDSSTMSQAMDPETEVNAFLLTDDQKQLNRRDIQREEQSMQCHIVGLTVGSLGGSTSWTHQADKDFLQAQRQRGAKIDWDDPNILPIISHDNRPDAIALQVFWAQCLEENLDLSSPPRYPSTKPKGSAAHQEQRRLISINPLLEKEMKSVADEMKKSDAALAALEARRLQQEERRKKFEQERLAAQGAQPSSTAQKKEVAQEHLMRKAAEVKARASGAGLEARRHLLRSQMTARAEERRAREEAEAAREALRDSEMAKVKNARLRAAAGMAREGAGRPTTPVTPVKVQDPKGYYERLGVTPTMQFLEPDQAVKVNQMLGATFRQLSWEIHPDRNPEADQAQQTRLNIAYDHVKTRKSAVFDLVDLCELMRVKYR